MRSQNWILVFVAALSWTLEGQTTWIVDASNGPGTNFTDLPPAVAAAANGDTIFVRAGNYTAFLSTGKALTIRGAGASSTMIVGIAPGSSISETKIDGVPAGMTFFMSGLKCAPMGGNAGSWPPLALTNAGLHVLGPGAVVLTDVTIIGPTIGGVGRNGLLVLNGAEVHLSRSTVTAGNTTAGFACGVGVESHANLAVDGSTITGGSSGPGNIAFPGAGMYVTGVATLSRSSVYGGSGFYAAGSSAIYCTGFVRVAGTSADIIKGASGLGGPGITLYASPTASVVVHGSVSVLPSSPGQPLTGGGGSVTIGAVALPYLSMTGTTTAAGELLASQPVTVTFDGVIPFALFACAVHLSPGFSTAFSSVLEGELLVPFPSSIVLEGTLDATGLAQVMFTPAVSAPSLTDVPIYVQFGVLDAVTGKVRMSNGLVRIFKN
jgi:hypothetical protein